MKSSTSHSSLRPFGWCVVLLLLGSVLSGCATTDKQELSDFITNSLLGDPVDPGSEIAAGSAPEDATPAVAGVVNPDAVYQSARFSTENIMSLKIHMSSDDVVNMFGEPEGVRSAMCGTNTGKAWQCTTWKYGDYGSDRASFTFYEEGGKLYLNNYDVDR